MLVVADTSPIHVLVRIDHVDVLPALFQRVVVPTAVAQ
jgi:predicted nucleic acid-binding protein